MLKLEDYIAKRKKEDELNEWDIEKRLENTKICVNYIFEYFDNYLDMSPAEEKTALRDQKLERYKKTLHDYDSEIRDWLVQIYSEYGKCMNRQIGNFIQDEYFLLYDTEAEFRSLSYDAYSKAVKKLPFLKSENEMLFLFIKDYHRVLNLPKPYETFPFIADPLNNWIDETYKKYRVNVLNFAYKWIDWFFENEDSWPATHRHICQDGYQRYDYDYKQKSNLFNMDSLYRNMPKKKFTRGRKQEFEILMLYYWLHDMVGDDDEYWQAYLKNVLPSIEKKL